MSFFEMMTLSDWLFVAVVDAIAFAMAFDLGRHDALSKATTPPLLEMPPRSSER